MTKEYQHWYRITVAHLLINKNDGGQAQNTHQTAPPAADKLSRIQHEKMKKCRKSNEKQEAATHHQTSNEGHHHGNIINIRIINITSTATSSSSIFLRGTDLVDTRARKNRSTFERRSASDRESR